MYRKTAFVIQGYIGLTEDEKAEFVREVNSYIKGSPETRSYVSKESKRVINIDMGPVGGACPYCGR